MKESIEKAVRNTPFSPFEIVMVGGSRLKVRHPEFIYVPPGRSYYFVWTDDDGVPAFYNANLVETVHPLRAQHGRRKAG